MFVVEYSRNQNCYHIGEEMRLLEGDIRAYEQRGWIGDYQTIARFETKDEARAFLRARRENT